MPAQLTSTSIGPTCRSTSATARRMLSSEPTSSATLAANAPAGACRSATATRAPSSVSSCAVAPPIPPAAPVMSAVLPTSPRSTSTCYAPRAMRPGVVGLLPGDPAKITAEHAKAVRALGFTGASITLSQPADTPTEALDHARTVLADHGLRVAQSNARYPALVHPDDATRREGVRLAQAACRAAGRLRAVYQLIRPGSLNPT